MLRIGIRDGYLNFYVKGQSVAKLSCGRGNPTIETHKKYIEGRRRHRTGEDTAAERNGKDYISVSAVELAKTETARQIGGWIETAETYASAESASWMSSSTTILGSST